VNRTSLPFPAHDRVPVGALNASQSAISTNKILPADGSETSRMSEVSTAVPDHAAHAASCPAQFHVFLRDDRRRWRKPDHSAGKCGKRFFANGRIIYLGFLMFASHGRR